MDASPDTSVAEQMFTQFLEGPSSQEMQILNVSHRWSVYAVDAETRCALMQALAPWGARTQVEDYVELVEDPSLLNVQLRFPRVDRFETKVPRLLYVTLSPSGSPVSLYFHGPPKVQTLPSRELSLLVMRHVVEYLGESDVEREFSEEVLSMLRCWYGQQVV